MSAQEHTDSALQTMYKRSVNSKVLVGSETSWRAVRIGELVLIALFGLILSSVMGHVSFILIAISAILAVLTSFHQVTSGVMEANGLHFKRYLRWGRLPWEAIEGITRSPMGTILITIKGGNPINGRLSLIPNPGLFGTAQGQASFDDLRTAWLASGNVTSSSE